MLIWPLEWNIRVKHMSYTHHCCYPSSYVHRHVGLFGGQMLSSWCCCGLLFLRRSQIYHCQRPGGELCDHLLQWRLLWHVRLHPCRGDAKAVHLQLPVRPAHSAAGRGTDGQSSTGLGGEEGGDLTVQERRWDAVRVFTVCHSTRWSDN